MGKAAELLTQAASVYHLMRNSSAEARTLIATGVVLNEDGKFERALEPLKKALAIFTLMGNRNGVAGSHLFLSMSYEGLGRYQEALDGLNLALPMARETRDAEVEGAILAAVSRIIKQQKAKAQP